MDHQGGLGEPLGERTGERVVEQMEPGVHDIVLTRGGAPPGGAPDDHETSAARFP
ncbi:hypothetical protein STXM2123_148 [Streptomyces sp. F-3]|nr:hypothetical protein STXM2123_148 [Streptomyces sp. F-3]